MVRITLPVVSQLGPDGLKKILAKAKGDEFQLYYQLHLKGLNFKLPFAGPTADRDF